MTLDCPCIQSSLLQAKGLDFRPGLLQKTSSTEKSWVKFQVLHYRSASSQQLGGDCLTAGINFEDVHTHTHTIRLCARRALLPKEHAGMQLQLTKADCASWAKSAGRSNSVVAPMATSLPTCAKGICLKVFEFSTTGKRTCYQTPMTCDRPALPCSAFELLASNELHLGPAV